MSDMVGQIHRTENRGLATTRDLIGSSRQRMRLPTLTFRVLQLSHALRSLVFGSEGVCGVTGAGRAGGGGGGGGGCGGGCGA